eukprot:scaffold209540_cov15-Tisochrysis_lutea.AAC.1
MQSLHKPPSERSAWPAPEEDKESREMQEMQIRTFMEEHCQNDELKDIDIHKVLRKRVRRMWLLHNQVDFEMGAVTEAAKIL